MDQHIDDTGTLDETSQLVIDCADESVTNDRDNVPETSTVSNTDTVDNASRTASRAKRKYKKRQTTKTPKKPRISIVSEEEKAAVDAEFNIDAFLEDTATKNNLSVANVRNILRHVITNQQVLSLLKHNMAPGEVDIDFPEPKLTRAKAREIFEKQPHLVWPSPVKQPRVSPTPTHQLLTTDLGESSSDDDEYQPSGEESDEELESIASSSFAATNDSAAPTSPRTFSECGTEPPTPLGDPTEPLVHHDDDLTKRQESLVSTSAVTTTEVVDNDEEGMIARRTRSKLPLEDTELENIEAAFVAPDITPDMYDTECDDDEWKKFLKDLVQKPIRALAVEEAEADVDQEEDEDPEYMFLEEEDQIDSWDLRNDRAVNISKQEVNQLVAELLELETSELLDSDDRRSARTPPLFLPPPSPLSLSGSAASCMNDSSQQTGGRQTPPVASTSGAAAKSPKIGADVGEKTNNSDHNHHSIVTVATPSRSKATPSKLMTSSVIQQRLLVENIEAGSEPLGMIRRQFDRFQEQMRMHVQLTTQLALLSQVHPYLGTTCNIAKRCLSELKEFSMASPYYGASNLDAAIDVVEKLSDLKAVSGSKRVPKKKAKVSRCIPQAVCRSICNSWAFLYWELFPTSSLFTLLDDPIRNMPFLRSEDFLLALGLEQFVPPTEPLSIQHCRLISELLLPTKSPYQIRQRVRNVVQKGVRGDNPILFWLEHRRAPDIVWTKREIDLNNPVLPKDMESVKQPPWMRRYSRSSHSSDSSSKSVSSASPTSSPFRSTTQPPSTPPLTSSPIVVTKPSPRTTPIPIAAAPCSTPPTPPPCIKPKFISRGRRRKDTVQRSPLKQIVSPILKKYQQKRLLPRPVIRSASGKLSKHTLQSFPLTAQRKAVLLKQMKREEREENVPFLAQVATFSSPLLSDDDDDDKHNDDDDALSRGNEEVIWSPQERTVCHQQVLLTSPRNSTSSLSLSLSSPKSVSRDNNSTTAAGRNSSSRRVLDFRNVSPLSDLSAVSSSPKTPVVVNESNHECQTNGRNGIVCGGSKTNNVEETTNLSNDVVNPGADEDLGLRKRNALNDSLSEYALEDKNEDKPSSMLKENVSNKCSEDDLEALMIACSTVVKKPPGMTATGLIKCPRKNRLQVKEIESSLALLADDIVSSDPLKSERNMLFRELFLAKCKKYFDGNPSKFMKFLELLKQREQQLTCKEMYEDLAKLFSDNPSMLDDFSFFLSPSEAIECGCFSKYLQYQQIRTFFRKVEIHFASQPIQMSRILRALKGLAAKQGDNGGDVVSMSVAILTTLQPLLRGQQHLLEELSSLLPTERVSQSLMTDFDEIRLSKDSDDEGSVRGDGGGGADEGEGEEPFEEVVLLSPSPEAVGSRNCPCSCHANDTDQKLAARERHCLECAIKFMDGRVFIQTGKCMRPAHITFLSQPPPPSSSSQQSASKSQSSSTSVAPSMPLLPVTSPEPNQRKTSRCEVAPSVAGRSTIPSPDSTTNATTFSQLFNAAGDITSCTDLSQISVQPLVINSVENTVFSSDNQSNVGNTVAPSVPPSGNNNTLAWTRDMDKILLETCKVHGQEAGAVEVARALNLTVDQAKSRLDHLISTFVSPATSDDDSSCCSTDTFFDHG